MSEKEPIKHGKITPEMAHEIQLQHFLNDIVPDVLRETISSFRWELKISKEADKLEKSDDVINIASSRYLQESLTALEQLSSKMIIDRANKELREGRGTLAIAFLTLYMCEMDCGDIESQSIETTLAHLIERSQRFSGKHYDKSDLMKWVSDREEILRMVTRQRRKDKRLPQKYIKEYKVLDRILSGHHEKNDLDSLRELINKDIASSLGNAEEPLADALLRPKPNYKVLEEEIENLLRLHEIRKLASQG